MSQYNDKESNQQKTLYFRVKGRVQGVFFRASTKSMADKLGITGWVRNRPDGDVEGMATGVDAQLDEFKSWLNRGPKLSKVTSVEIHYVDFEEYTGYEVQ